MWVFFVTLFVFSQLMPIRSIQQNSCGINKPILKYHKEKIKKKWIQNQTSHGFVVVIGSAYWWVS